MSADKSNLVSANTRLIDLEHLGTSEVIASCVFESPMGSALIDPGPASTIKILQKKLAEHGVQISDLTSILLTHIHLDHAGATGELVQLNPKIKVYVHERGAPHMINPERLVRSATRLYGADMDRLWGPFLPVPTTNIQTLSGGETLNLSGRIIKVAYTPGHASHHVSYLDTESGVAFVGDTCGIRISNLPYVLPATPPPDVNLELWKDSLAKISKWQPVRLFLTHFGPADGVADQIANLWDALQERTDDVRQSLQTEGTDSERSKEYVRRIAFDLRCHLSEDESQRFEAGSGVHMGWAGLARYLRKSNNFE